MQQTETSGVLIRKHQVSKHQVCWPRPLFMRCVGTGGGGQPVGRKAYPADKHFYLIPKNPHAHAALLLCGRICQLFLNIHFYDSPNNKPQYFQHALPEQRLLSPTFLGTRYGQGAKLWIVANRFLKEEVSFKFWEVLQ